MGEGVHWPFFYPCKLLGVGGRTDLRRVALHLPSCGHPQTVPCVERSLLEKGGTKLWYGLILLAEGLVLANAGYVRARGRCLFAVDRTTNTKAQKRNDQVFYRAGLR